MRPAKHLRAHNRQARQVVRLLRRRAQESDRWNVHSRWNVHNARTVTVLRAFVVLCIALVPAATPAQAPQSGSQMTSGEAGQKAPRIIYGQDGGTAGADAQSDVTRPGLPAAGKRSAAVPQERRGNPPENASPDPLVDLRRRWQEAVRTGATDLGFRAWVLGALDPEADGKTDPMRVPPSGSNTAPDKGPAARPQAQRTREVSERWEKRAGPVVLGEAGRVVTVFGASIPTAFCAPLLVCTIELEPGEHLTDTPSWGDTVRWQGTAKVQGDDPETMVFEIKPSDDAGMTNLVIPTDRRLYNITLVKDDRVHTPILSFTYPDTVAKQAKQRIADRKARKADEARRAAAAKAAAARKREETLQRNGVETASGLKEASKLDFGFRITGNAPFRPVRVYSDGKQTYIDLRPSYSGPLPALVPGRSEENKVLNTRVEAGGTRLVADRVIRDMWLQAGKRRVRIRRSGR